MPGLKNKLDISRKGFLLKLKPDPKQKLDISKESYARYKKKLTFPGDVMPSLKKKLDISTEGHTLSEKET